MKANTRSAAEIFGFHLRYVVPLFQRPYVWNEKDQWAPLWEDVRAVAEQLLDQPPQPFGASTVAPHFLGAIVVENQPGVVGFIAVWHVIDGQQRLTTLQLLLDAAQDVVEDYGSEIDANALRVLVLNLAEMAQNPDERFKVWPTDRDQAAFRAVMDDGAAVPPALAESSIARAHAFFRKRIAEWAQVTGDPQLVRARLNALVYALRDHLKVVIIDLEPGDNAQVIFETLNHRGTPLLAADLVKNLVFQIAQTHHEDVLGLYQDHWKPLDGDYWRGLTAQGRLYRPRIDVFLNYWLTMKLVKDVHNDRVFADFRDLVARDQPIIGELVTEVSRDASVFARFDTFPEGSVGGLFHYRVVKALDTGAVTPVLIWLFRWTEAELPTDQRHRALRAIESWLVRRTLARLTAKNVNQVILDLLRTLAASGPTTAGERTEEFFAAQTADSRLWPDDDTVRAALATAPVYTGLLRPRLRMILEALEDDLRRDDLGEGQPCPRGLTVEHVMPRQWREHWPLDPDDLARALHRDAAVHRLGNLTLVTGKHNSALSNRPWRSATGKDKRAYLLAHSHLKLNAEIVARHEEEWTEENIAARTATLTDRILRLWPRPVTARPTSVAPESIDSEFLEPSPAEDEDDTTASHVGKYRELWRWLRDEPADEIRLTFGEVEQILGIPLPRSSRVHLPHWYSYEGSAVVRAIHDAGWRAAQVSLTDEQVTFVRGS